MREPQSIIKITVLWRGKKLIVEISKNAALKELGHELQKLSNVKGDTMRLIVPQISSKSSKLMYPFSDEHSSLTLLELHISEGKTITMMGVSESEVDEVLQVAKADLRIAGFDEEEKRLRQRRMDRPHTSLKLPQGSYIFCDFRTLEIPGFELNPPPSEALKRMHMLAADPGIVAIMNKHRWRVGIMTEMAPVGYVGISPKCLLGFNKNHGEEISLRLRTDDLKGFRKYESIKKTLLHELAHMVFSEHDANFYALDSQLNREAANLDWTRSKGHTLSGVRHSEHNEEEFYLEDGSNYSQKLGGSKSDHSASARTSSVTAAYNRLASASSTTSRTSEVLEEPDPDDSGVFVQNGPDPLSSAGQEILSIQSLKKDQHMHDDEPDPDDCSCEQKKFELKADDLSITNVKMHGTHEEPDPDDSEFSVAAEPGHYNSQAMDILDGRIEPRETMNEPDQDELEGMTNKLRWGDTRPDDHDSMITESEENQAHVCKGYSEPDPDESNTTEVVQAEPDPDDSSVPPMGVPGFQSCEPDPDDQELQRIQDPVSILCNRLQTAIKMLQSEVDPMEATRVLQTLLKIIRNVIEHPDEMKFRRLRKANPTFQQNVANYKAAMEILFVIGFYEDITRDDMGKAESYLVLKRNDPGLLWLVKSSLETCTA